jgi:hypothetical protein
MPAPPFLVKQRSDGSVEMWSVSWVNLAIAAAAIVAFVNVLAVLVLARAHAE